MCVEAGGFEAMAVRAAQSLRTFGGRFSSCKVYAVTPRFGPSLSKKTLQAFEQLHVDYLNVRPPNRYSWYPLMNKPLTLVEVAKRSDAGQIVFIDSDMIVCAEPNLLLLEDATDFTACAPDKNIGSAGEDDINTPFWKQLCNVLGTSFDQLPWVHAHRDHVDIRLYFNSGIFTFRRTGPFALAYQSAVEKLLDSRLSSQVSNIYFHEQAAVGVVAAVEKLRWKPLPHEYNYAVGRKIMDKYEPEKVRRAVILHYHDMMWPENWTNLMDRLKVDRPEIHDWLATLGPLKVTSSAMQKMTGKLLGKLRKRKSDRHKASCRVV
jgi:lipopolysaccharide biosynthesis glycosyltransferase